MTSEDKNENINIDIGKLSEKNLNIMKEMKKGTIKKIGEYLLFERIGRGTFSKVIKAIHIPTEQPIAVKILEKDKIEDEIDVERIMREIEILKNIDHPHICQTYETFSTVHNFYLMMELVEGGDLFDYVSDNTFLSEQKACYFFRQLISVIEYLSEMEITHRDIKLENILLDKNKQNIKVIDFGLSNYCSDKELLKSSCGSPCYASPEMLSGKPYHGICTDLWSSGIVLYSMLVGSLPFEEQELPVLYEQIKKGKFYIPSNLSLRAIDILKKLLNVNPSERITLQQIKNHPWFNLEKNPMYKGINILKEKFPYNKSVVEYVINNYFENDNEVNVEKLIEMIVEHECNKYTATYYLTKKYILGIEEKYPVREETKKIKKNLDESEDSLNLSEKVSIKEKKHKNKEKNLNKNKESNKKNELNKTSKKNNEFQGIYETIELDNNNKNLGNHKMKKKNSNSRDKNDEKKVINRYNTMQLIGFKNKVIDTFNSPDNNKNINPASKKEDNLKNGKTISTNNTHSKVKTNFFVFNRSNNSPIADEKNDSEKKSHQKFLSNDENLCYNPKKNSNSKISIKKSMKEEKLIFKRIVNVYSKPNEENIREIKNNSVNCKKDKYNKNFSYASIQSNNMNFYLINNIINKDKSDSKNQNSNSNTINNPKPKKTNYIIKHNTITNDSKLKQHSVIRGCVKNDNNHLNDEPMSLEDCMEESNNKIKVNLKTEEEYSSNNNAKGVDILEKKKKKLGNKKKSDLEKPKKIQGLPLQKIYLITNNRTNELEAFNKDKDSKANTERNSNNDVYSHTENKKRINSSIINNNNYSDFNTFKKYQKMGRKKEKDKEKEEDKSKENNCYKKKISPTNKYTRKTNFCFSNTNNKKTSEIENYSESSSKLFKNFLFNKKNFILTNGSGNTGNSISMEKHSVIMKNNNLSPSFLNKGITIGLNTPKYKKENVYAKINICLANNNNYVSGNEIKDENKIISRNNVKVNNSTGNKKMRLNLFHNLTEDNNNGKGQNK